MGKLSPEGLATVIKDLVNSGLWLNQHSTGAGKRQLQNIVLKLHYMQELPKDHAFAMMQAIAELRYSITPVMIVVNGASDISSEQVATLLKLAVLNGEMSDVCYLAKCTNAVEVEADCVLQVGWRLLFSLELEQCCYGKPLLRICVNVCQVILSRLVVTHDSSMQQPMLLMPSCLPSRRGNALLMLSSQSG